MLPFLWIVWNTTLELAPWLLLGAFVAGLLHVLLPANFIQRQLTGRWSVLKAVALGVPLPLCSCGVIPMAVGMHRQRASRGATVGFLISTPQTGVDSVLVSAAMLGWPFALFKVVAALVTGLVGGGIANLVAAKEAASPKPASPDAALPIMPSDSTTSSSASAISSSASAIDTRDRSLRGVVEHALEILRSIWGWLVIGVVISALISTLLGDQLGAGSLAAYGTLAAMGVALAISLPLYVCATSSVPIAAALVGSGLPPGAALVFLMAGPATNVATLGAVHRTLGGRILAVYLTTIIAGSMLGGWLFDSLLATPAGGGPAHVHHEPSWWNIASGALLIALIVWFAAGDLWRRYRKAVPVVAQPGASTVRVAIEGMTCGNCVAKVEKKLSGDPAIHSATVTLDPPEVVVVGEATSEQVGQLIQQAGFRVPTGK